MNFYNSKPLISDIYDFFGQTHTIHRSKKTIKEIYDFFSRDVHHLSNYCFPQKLFSFEDPFLLDEVFRNTTYEDMFVENYYADLRRSAMQNDAFLPLSLGYDKQGLMSFRDLQNMHALLISGMTRYGKTTLCYDIILGLLLTCHPEFLKLVVFDSAKSDFFIFKDLLSLYSPLFKDEKKSINAGIDTLLEEISRRQAIIHRLGVRNGKEANEIAYSEGKFEYLIPYIVVFSDEFFTDKKCVEKMAKIVSQGGASNLIFIFSLQYSPAEKVTTDLKQGFGFRAGFRVADEITEKVNLGKTNTGAMDLERGQFIFNDYGLHEHHATIDIPYTVIEAIVKNIKNLRNWSFAL